MHFIPELSIGSHIFTPVKVRKHYEIVSCPSGFRFRVHSALDKAMVTMIKKERIDDVELLAPWVQRNIDLSHLLALKQLRALTIHSGFSIDWRPLQLLTWIEKLTLRTSSIIPQYIDFSAFSKLRRCKLSWHAEWDNILESKTIQHLTIEDGVGMSDLSLEKMRSLREVFALNCSGLRQLYFDRKQRIVSIGMSECRSFEGFSPEAVLTQCEYFALGGSSRFSVDRLSNCRNLRRLFLDGIGKVPSIRFLRGCHKLETLRMLFSTEIEDGDFSELEQLPRLREVFFKNRRHYSHKAQQLQRIG